MFPLNQELSPSTYGKPCEVQSQIGCRIVNLTYFFSCFQCEIFISSNLNSWFCFRILPTIDLTLLSDKQPNPPISLRMRNSEQAKKTLSAYHAAVRLWWVARKNVGLSGLSSLKAALCIRKDCAMGFANKCLVSSGSTASTLS